MLRFYKQYIPPPLKNAHTHTPIPHRLPIKHIQAPSQLNICTLSFLDFYIISIYCFLLESHFRWFSPSLPPPLLCLLSALSGWGGGVQGEISALPLRSGRRTDTRPRAPDSWMGLFFLGLPPGLDDSFVLGRL